MRCFLVLSLVGACLALPAAEQVVEDFRDAMSGQDAHAKQRAIGALAGSGLDDDVVLPLLVGAVGDRQAGRYAVPALRRRTGLAPSPSREGNTGYPGYPSGDSVGAWRTWLSQRAKAQEAEAKLEAAMATAEEAKAEAAAAATAVAAEALDIDGDGAVSAEEQAAGAAADADGDGVLSEEEQATAIAAHAEATGGEAAANDDSPPPTADRVDGLDRVFLADGSILRCYVLTKRTDLEGRLTSVKIAHRDGGGEEVIDAALIARIEEDVR